MIKRKRKTVLMLIISLCLSLFGSLCFPASVSAYDYSLPSLWQEYEDYFIIGTFGNWNTTHSKYHYRYSSFANDLKLDAQIGGTATGNNTPSQNEYNRRVAEINADTSLSDAEKAQLIEEANRNVVLSANPNSIRLLNEIRAYNATVSERDKKKIRAHVLVWHGGQQPMYFFCDGFNYSGNTTTANWASPETMLARLDNYIQKMMERYAPYNDIIYSWDVVNEGLDDYTGQVRNMDDPLTQSGQWGNIFRRTDLNDPGEEDQRLYEESVYIRKAFESARKYSNLYGADWTLYYNDFQDSNKPYEPKMSQTIKMLKPIYEAGNIDGYGMQGRLATAYPSIDLLRQQIELGLTVADEISITEADIRSDFMPNPDWDPSKPAEPTGDSTETNTYDVRNGPAIRRDGWGRMNQDGWTRDKALEIAMREDIQREQADYTADLMDLLIEYKDKFVVMQWDGSSDRSTFNSYKGAHLWGGVTGNPEKMSYFAFIGAPNRDKLKNALQTGPTDNMAGNYPAQLWAAYQEAKAIAEPLVNKRIYDINGVNAVKEALANLNSTIGALNSACRLSLDGSSSVQPGSTFTVGVGLYNISQDVYAEELTMNFDPEVFVYDTVTGADPNKSVLVKDPSVSGTLRIVAANIGGVKGDNAPLLGVGFKVKDGVADVSSSISITSAKLGIMPEGAVIQPTLASKTIAVGTAQTVDKSGLIAAIDAAQAAYDNAVVGTAPGQYPASAKAAFLEAINEASAVNTNPDATQADVNTAVSALTEAKAIFDGSVIPDPGTDKRALKEAIDAAQSLYDSAVVGTQNGCYRLADKITFQLSIAAANSVFSNINASQEDIDHATSALLAAKAVFEASVITDRTGDINHSTGIDVGDLAIIAYYYGAIIGDENWEAAKIADINNDGKVDIEDLAFVALRMRV
ncbi:hypothetical protein FRZ06_00445 [Anoxybacterium hadale]|uniref:Uncharacterized protein n=1 Tax=Anoxybacterium hadale TaxID=3408580 RepID=A0ACD1A6D4_9FIRM|nr:hypothetical protein FRZ06_00445 [Clostridiales bacterium]